MDIIRDIWEKANKGMASKEEIHKVKELLRGDHDLNGIERRIIEGDLQKALSKLIK